MFVAPSSELYQVVQVLDQDCHSVRPDLGSHCLQRLSADDKSSERKIVNEPDRLATYYHGYRVFTFGP